MRLAQVPGESDGLFLSNVEGLNMSGIEFTGDIAYSMINQTRFELRVWGAMNRHSFDPFAKVVPGTPLHTAGSAGKLSLRSITMGLAAMNGWIASNCTTAKTIGPKLIHRLLVYIQREHHGQQWQVGMRNPLNFSYSSWLQTNAFGGRYFNPAPKRTLWLSWRWMFGL